MSSFSSIELDAEEIEDIVMDIDIEDSNANQLNPRKGRQEGTETSSVSILPPPPKIDTRSDAEILGINSPKDIDLIEIDDDQSSRPVYKRHIDTLSSSLSNRTNFEYDNWTPQIGKMQQKKDALFAQL